MNLSFDYFLPGAGVMWFLTVTVLTAIVHLGFAIAVFNDCYALWARLHRKTFFVGVGLWSLATLLGGVLVAAIYWLMHHSTLRPNHPPPPNE